MPIIPNFSKKSTQDTQTLTNSLICDIIIRLPKLISKGIKEARTVTNEKLAVFSTSDIFSTYPMKKGAKPFTTIPQPNRKPLEIYKTGQLETALAQGFTVIVITTRSKLMAHDDWWKELVGEDNIIITPPFNDYDNEARTAGLNQPWRELTRRYGIEDQFDWSKFWTSLRFQILERLDAKSGGHFREPRK